MKVKASDFASHQDLIRLLKRAEVYPESVYAPISGKEVGALSDIERLAAAYYLLMLRPFVAESITQARQYLMPIATDSKFEVLVRAMRALISLRDEQEQEARTWFAKALELGDRRFQLVHIDQLLDLSQDWFSK